jgi:hypothetical protein
MCEPRELMYYPYPRVAPLPLGGELQFGIVSLPQPHSEPQSLRKLEDMFPIYAKSRQ